MRFQKMDLRAATIAAALTASLGLAAAPADAKVEGDTITLGAAMSLTGKYSTNGIDTQNGYQLALDMINNAGGVTVGGKSYKRCAACRAPDQSGRRQIYAWPVQFRPDQGDRAGYRKIQDPDDRG